MEKNFRPNFVFRRLQRQHPLLQGPDTETHFSNPPSFGGRPCPPPPQVPFSGRRRIFCTTVAVVSSGTNMYAPILRKNSPLSNPGGPPQGHKAPD